MQGKNNTNGKEQHESCDVGTYIIVLVSQNLKTMKG